MRRSGAPMDLAHADRSPQVDHSLRISRPVGRRPNRKEKPSIPDTWQGRPVRRKAMARWRVDIVKVLATLGSVDAPDERSAIEQAARQFHITPARRKSIKVVPYAAAGRSLDGVPALVRDDLVAPLGRGRGVPGLATGDLGGARRERACRAATRARARASARHCHRPAHPGNYQARERPPIASRTSMAAPATRG